MSGDETPTEPRPSAPEHIDADWPMPAHDAGRSNYSPVDGTERWSRPGDGIDRFVVADDLVFTTGDGAIRAFRPP